MIAHTWLAELARGQRKGLLYALTMILVSGSGCGTSTISGQVFIVTKGHESVRLGLVEVSLLPEALARKYSSQRQAELKAARIALAAELDSLQRALGEAQGQVSVATEAYNAARRRRQGTEMARQMSIVRQGEAVEQRCMAGFDAFTSRQAALESVSHSLYGLPAGIAHTQTDANGEFILRVPRPGRFVLAAQTQRQVFGTTESYSWLVSIPKEARKGAKVLLSNEALTSGTSLSLPIIPSGREDA